MSRLTKRILADSFARSVPQGARHRPFAGFDAKTLMRAAAVADSGNLYGNNPPSSPPRKRARRANQQPQDTTKKGTRSASRSNPIFQRDSVRAPGTTSGGNTARPQTAWRSARWDNDADRLAHRPPVLPRRGRLSRRVLDRFRC